MSNMQTKIAGRRARRRFTSEFKAGAVRLVLEEGKTIGSVARELDLVPSALGSWVARAQADRTRGRTGLTSEERAELAHLRKENRELRMARETLKRAAAGSTGRCNTCDAHSRREKAQDLSWPSIEAHRNHIELALVEGR